MRFAQKRRQHVGGEQIEVVVRPVKVCRHGRDKIRAILARVGLAKLDPGNFGNGIRFVRWLERSAEQGGFRDWLRRMLRINARAAQKKKFAHSAVVRRVNDVVLNAQIIEQKFDGKIRIRFDPAHFCRRENHDGRFFLSEEIPHGLFVCEVQLRAVALDQVAKTPSFEPPDQSAAHQAAMTRDKDLF